MESEEKVKANIQLVRGLSNELAAYLHTLPDNIWRNADDYPSNLEGWKIADIVTHLIMGANTFVQSITNALQGNSSAPMGFNPSASDEERIGYLQELREAYYEDLFYEFNASCLRLNSLMVSLEPESYELPSWHRFFTLPVKNLIDIRASELAVHGWDIRYPIDRSSKLSERAVPFLLDWLPRWLYTGFQKGDTLDTPLRYRFDLSDAEGGYDIVITGEKFRHMPSEDADADVTFTCDADTYILFCMGRLPFNRSVRRGRLSFEGDEKLASGFMDWFKGV